MVDVSVLSERIDAKKCAFTDVKFRWSISKLLIRRDNPELIRIGPRINPDEDIRRETDKRVFTSSQISDVHICNFIVNKTKLDIEVED